MSDKSTIEWCDATWNPITGCSILTPGCTNCYAMRLAGTRLRNHPSREGLTSPSKAGPVWNGKVRFNEDWLEQPLKWKRPRRIFVCAHGDLFHESIPDEWIDKVFAVMACAGNHTFQVLTKRSRRMITYVANLTRERIQKQAYALSVCVQYKGRWLFNLPLDNVWLGISCERQQEAEERIPDLLATPAAVRFISAEPLLGPIELGPIVRKMVFDGTIFPDGKTHPLGWVIVGGESGPGARYMSADWAASLRDQCVTAGIPYFFKQWGTFNALGSGRGRVEKTRKLMGREWNEMPGTA